MERATLAAVKAAAEVAMEARALEVVMAKVADTEATGWLRSVAAYVQHDDEGDERHGEDRP